MLLPVKKQSTCWKAISVFPLPSRVATSRIRNTSEVTLRNVTVWQSGQNLKSYFKVCEQLIKHMKRFLKSLVIREMMQIKATRPTISTTTRKAAGRQKWTLRDWGGNGGHHILTDGTGKLTGHWQGSATTSENSASIVLLNNYQRDVKTCAHQKTY